MKIAVILPAAGIGKRFAVSSSQANENRCKLEADLLGQPVFMRSVSLFANRNDVCQVILAVNPDKLADFRFKYGDKLGFYNVKLVAGGKKERWETVLKALDAVDENITHVAIHDAARPLASVDLIDRVFEAGKHFDAVIPGMPVFATLRRTSPLSPTQQPTDILGPQCSAILSQDSKPTMHIQKAIETVDRQGMVQVQTPQLFDIALLKRAYQQVAQGTRAVGGVGAGGAESVQGFRGGVSGASGASGVTDDAGLVEQLGQTIYVVPGEATNLKITQPQDMLLAQMIVAHHQSQKNKTLDAKKRFAQDDDD